MRMEYHRQSVMHGDVMGLVVHIDPRPALGTLFVGIVHRLASSWHFLEQWHLPLRSIPYGVLVRLPHTTHRNVTV